MTCNIVCVCSFRSHIVSGSIVRIPTLGYLINWRSKPSVNFLHAVDLCYELCAAHNSAIVHFVTPIVRSTCEPFSAMFAVIWYCLSDCLMYASACLSQT